MEFNYLIERRRMLNSIGRTKGRCSNISCSNCPLFIERKGKIPHCADMEYPIEATEIVRKWAEEHPRKTRKDVLLEKFPNAVMHFENDYPRTCAECLGLCTHDECQSAESCFECWYTEVEE